MSNLQVELELSLVPVPLDTIARIGTRRHQLAEGEEMMFKYSHVMPVGVGVAE